MDYKLPIPESDEEQDPFWEGLKRHEFLLMRCKKCHAWYWPPSYCRSCGVDNEPLLGSMRWEKASGKGKIFVFNIIYRALHPAFKDEIPYCTAMIVLDEGPIFGSRIVGCDPKDVSIGMPVEVVFEDVTKAKYANIKEDFTLPLFKPADAKKPARAVRAR